MKLPSLSLLIWSENMLKTLALVRLDKAEMKIIKLKSEPPVEKISILSPLSHLRAKAEIEADTVSSLWFLAIRRVRGKGPALYNRFRENLSFILKWI